MTTAVMKSPIDVLFSQLEFGTAKPRKWWPRKWRTSLDGGWYLDLLFLKWRGKTSENGGF